MLSDLIVENVPVGVILTQNGQVCYINEWACTFSGYSVKDVTNRSFLDLIHPEDQEHMIQRYADIMDGKDAPKNRRYRVIGKKGQVFQVMFRSRIVEHEGQPALLTLLIDETKSWEQEQSLKKSEERYRELVDNLAEGIVVLCEGKICFINKMLRKELGLRLKDVSKIPFLSFVHPEDQATLLERHQKRMKGFPIAQTYEVRMLKPDGTQVLCEIRSAVVSWEGKPAIQAAILDITQRREAERVKQQLEKRVVQMEKMEALGLLAGGVAHDLNNVLSGVVSYPELLLMDLPKDHPFVNPLDLIHSSGKKASAIVNDLLTLARRGVVSTTVLNLNTVIEEYLMSPEHRQMLRSHDNIKIDVLLDPNLFNINGAQVHLQKTIMNLVTNAAEAQSSGGNIRITTHNQYIDKPLSGYESINEGEYAVVVIEDDGTGIEAQDLARIFEPFYTKKIMGRSGTGLGMAVVWGTVQDHKGYIHVESGEEMGARFSMYFPVFRQEIVQSLDSMPVESYMGNREMILVVDDIKEQRQIAQKILNRLNYRVETVESGEKALEYLEQNSCDLLLLDMIMEPGMDGFETYEIILKTNPKQKAVIASGFSEDDRVKKIQKLGAGCYVKKPYSIEQIGLVIKQELST